MINDRYSNARLQLLVKTGLTQTEMAKRLSVLQFVQGEPRVSQGQVSRWLNGQTIQSRFWDSIETLHSEVMAEKAIKLQK